MSVFSSSIHNHLKLETSQMSFYVENTTIVQSFDGLVIRNKQEWATGSRSNMEVC